VLTNWVGFDGRNAVLPAGRHIASQLLKYNIIVISILTQDQRCLYLDLRNGQLIAKNKMTGNIVD
jgi:hypothetical protein